MAKEIPFVLAVLANILMLRNIVLMLVGTGGGRAMTNAEKYFRNATDEEIAEIIAEDWCELIDCKSAPFCDGECKERILAWLQQEADT